MKKVWLESVIYERIEENQEVKKPRNEKDRGIADADDEKKVSVNMRSIRNLFARK